VTTHAVQEGSSNTHADRAETMSSGIVIPDSGEITIPNYGGAGASAAGPRHPPCP
jgi:hypothetical protein